MRPFCFNHSIVITGQRRKLTQLYISAVISVSPDIFYRIRHRSTCPVEQQLFLSIAIYIVQSKIRAFLSIGIRHFMICSLDFSETICIPQDFAKHFCLFLCRKRLCPINCKNAIISAYGSRIGSILSDIFNPVSKKKIVQIMEHLIEFIRILHLMRCPRHSRQIHQLL